MGSQILLVICRKRFGAGSATGLESAAGTGKSLIDIRRTLHQSGTLADQLIGAPAARIKRRAGNRHHLAALFAGQPGGDEGAGLKRCLHHHGPQRPGRRRCGCAGGNAGPGARGPAASRSPAARARRCRGRGARSPAGRAVEAPGQHGDGAARPARRDGRRIDAPGKAGDDDPAQLRRARAPWSRPGAGHWPRHCARPTMATARPASSSHLAEGQKQGRGVIGFGEHRREKPGRP